MKSNPFFKAFGSVISTPIYLIFAIVLIIYAITGSLAEAALLLLLVLAGVSVKSLFRLKNEKVFGKADGGPSTKGKVRTVGGFNSVILIISVVSAVLAVPILIIGLVNPGEGGIGAALARVLAAMTLLVSLLYSKDGSALEFSMALHLSDKNGAAGMQFRDIDSLQRIASADCAVILNPAVLYDRTPEVREVFFDSAVYRGMSLTESELSVPSEKAYFLSLIAILCSEEGFRNIPSHEDAFERFNTVQCMSKTSFYLGASSMDYSADYPAKGDVTVYSEFSDSNTNPVALTRSVSAASIDSCEYCRRNDGRAVPITDYDRKKARSAVSSLIRRGLTPYVIISSDFITDRNGKLSRPVLEAVFGVGGVFPESNSDAASALCDYGVRPVLVMPDSKASFVNFASESGIADGPEDIAFFEGNNDFIEYSDARKVYVGFRDESVIALLQSMRKQGRKPLCILRNSKDLSTLCEAEASVAVKGSSDAETQNVADTLIPAASKRPEDGLGSLFNVVTSASSAVAKIGMLRNIYFSFAVAVLMTVLITLLSGASVAAPSGLQLLFSCGITAVTAAFICAEDKLITRTASENVDSPSKEKGRYIKYLGLGIVLSVVLIAVGLLFFKDSANELRKYLSISIPLSGIALIQAERLFRSKEYGISGINLVSLITVLVSVLFSFGLAFVNMPDALSFSFGSTENPLKVLAISLIPCLVPFVYLLIALVIKKKTAEENVNNL